MGDTGGRAMSLSLLDVREDKWGLTEPQRMIRDMVREFAVESVEPRAAEIDRNNRFPEETFREMADMGLMGLPIAEQYGGGGADYLSYCIAVEELARVIHVALRPSVADGCAQRLQEREKPQRQWLNAEAAPDLDSCAGFGAIFRLTPPRARARTPNRMGTGPGAVEPGCYGRPLEAA